MWSDRGIIYWWPEQLIVLQFPRSFLSKYRRACTHQTAYRMRPCLFNYVLCCAVLFLITVVILWKTLVYVRQGSLIFSFSSSTHIKIDTCIIYSITPFAHAHWQVQTTTSEFGWLVIMKSPFIRTSFHLLNHCVWHLVFLKVLICN